MNNQLSQVLFRAWAHVRHRLCAWNTGGEGIHSPRLFYIVRYLMNDHNAYYCFDAIEQRREAMLRAPKMIDFIDYGTGHNGQRLVSHIARTSLESPQVMQLLFRLVLFLSQQLNRPLHIVELGTSLGISTAYLQMANLQNHVLTFEGCPQVMDMAQKNWHKLGLDTIQSVVGNIDEVLHDTLLNSARVIDFAYLDAHHTCQATLDYYAQIKPYLQSTSMVVLDDIHYSADMERAWKQILSYPEITSTMDLGSCGILFLDPHYLRKHYILRI